MNDEGLADARAATPFVSTIMFVPIMSAHAKGGTASDTSAAAPRAREVLKGVRTRLQSVEWRAALERAPSCVTSTAPIET
jgi:hypothetical protein